jgi:hypothetical protein
MDGILKKKCFHKNVTDSASNSVRIERGDPYFMWALLNDGERVSSINGTPRSGSATEPQGLDQCKPTGFVPPHSYLQVVIEVAEGTGSSVGKDKKRIGAFEEHLRRCRGGLRPRGAYLSQTDPHKLAQGCRFVTAIVADWWLPCFLKDIAKMSVRWEIGHARYVGKRDFTDDANTEQKKWHNDDVLLDGDVMVVIDYGCPFAHRLFRTNGSTRIRYVWFQGAEAISTAEAGSRVMRHGTPNTLFPYGHELRGSEIDSLIAKYKGNEDACYEAIGYDLMREASTHGGHVMSIACGAPNPLSRKDGEDWLYGVSASSPSRLGPEERDSAGQASIIFVELPRASVADSSGGSMNVHLVDALQYVLERTAPTATITVNCSMGTHGGPHNGSSILEQAIDHALSRRAPFKYSLVVPIGNSYNNDCHAFWNVRTGSSLQVTVDIPADKSTDTFIEIWYTNSAKVDDLELAVVAPNGQRLIAVSGNSVTLWSDPSVGPLPLVTIACVEHATSTSHRALVVIAPTLIRENHSRLPEAQYGHWKLEAIAKGGAKVIPVDVWIERDDAIFDTPSDRQARFVARPTNDSSDEHPRTQAVTKEATFTSYATTTWVYVAGGYVRPIARYRQQTGNGVSPLLASYSAAGSSRNRSRINKPDFVAPVDDSAVLLGRNAAGTYSRSWVRRNGTSVASPQAARNVLNSKGAWGTLTAIAPNLLGDRGEGLSKEGELLQFDRFGLGIKVPW